MGLGGGNGKGRNSGGAGGDAAVCSLLRVGSLASGHTFSSGQAAVDETFAPTFSTTRDIPEKLEYDAAGNMTNDGIYKYTYDAWNRRGANDE